jgi:hypothetical protein
VKIQSSQAIQKRKKISPEFDKILGRYMKYGQKLKLGDAHVTSRNIQEVQASKLGDAPRHSFFIDKYQVTFQDTIFLLLHIL